MELFGVGPLELLFILIIALIVLGPRDMVKAGRTLGQLMRRTILSPTWMKIQREIRSLPYQMMREAGLEEEDLRIDMGIDNAYNPSSNQIASLPEQNQTTPLPSQEGNKIGRMPDVPNEWLGLPVPEQKQTDGNLLVEEQSPLTEWTSAPKDTPFKDPEEAKDSK
jgi:hypothetical protein